MITIYQPKGKAKEYSPLALNIYIGCDHKCEYCYVKNFYQAQHTIPVYPRKNLIEELKKTAPNYSNKEQVLLCFTGDPYCSADNEYKITRQILEILLKNKITTAILTKGGKRCLRDIDLFKQFKNQIKIGATLTFTNKEKSLKYESGAATPQDRFETLQILHQNGIKTWASLEPVIEEEETLKIIKETKNYIDEYKVGVTNYFQLPKPINWKEFGLKAIELLRKNNKAFYIKYDLQQYIPNNILTKEESDPNYLTIKPQIIQNKLL